MSKYGTSATTIMNEAALRRAWCTGRVRSGVSLRIAVVGGGIGGLATAAVLHRAGLDATVYEQAGEIREIGAGLVVAPNAVRLLRRLGRIELFRETAVPLEVGWEFRRWQDGRVLYSQRMGAECERLYGEWCYTTHRADLLDTLFSAVPEPGPRLDARCVRVRRHGGRAELSFADGSAPTADVVIGADGADALARTRPPLRALPDLGRTLRQRGRVRTGGRLADRVVDRRGQDRGPARRVRGWGPAAHQPAGGGRPDRPLGAAGPRPAPPLDRRAARADRRRGASDVPVPRAGGRAGDRGRGRSGQLPGRRSGRPAGRAAPL